ncbi:DMT family transporter [Exilibacterium tricleocarpae]|uniref:DMT family transporter n=1 Tax=Exilibacterium tricleocarpae TaxID=2591008 RepID=A0A545TLG2_9GAMM|nr:DMT family transporter [Exilibacterium tricleocarpae]TQV78064.1 DMT family transporter [Exilibacterium tricleocarpae]
MAAAILSAACWGSATVLSKGVLEHMPPMTLLIIQLTASVAFLWITALVLRVRCRFDRRALRGSLSGLLEPGIAYTLGVVGLALTTASNASLIGTAEPLFVVLLAWILLRERVSASMLGLVLMASLGIGLVVIPDISNDTGEGSLLGDALITAGTLFAALYVIATRKLVMTFDPISLSAMQQSVGLIWTLGVLTLALSLGLTTVGLGGVGLDILILAAVSGVVQYALAFGLYLLALQRLPANIAAFYLALIPVFGVGTAYIFLDEVLTPLQWPGAVFIIISVGAVSYLSQE